MADMLIDLKNSLVSGASLTPQLVSTNTNATGSAVDMSNATGPVSAVLNVGTVAGTSPTMNLVVQANSTSATTGFTDVSGATFTQVTTSTNRQVIRFDLPDGKPYVRVTGTFSTQVTGFMVGVDFFAQKKLQGTTDSGVSRAPSS